MLDIAEYILAPTFIFILKKNVTWEGEKHSLLKNLIELSFTKKLCKKWYVYLIKICDDFIG